MDRQWGNNATKGNGWVVRTAFGVTRRYPWYAKRDQPKLLIYLCCYCCYGCY